MFIDEVKINVKGGDGGNGCVSLHHEIYQPNGGPDGGNGGRGGSVILEGSSRHNTLSFFGKRVHFKAQRGGHGKGNRKNGKDGKDALLQVPLGTVVYDAETGNMLGDITREGQQLNIAPGGRGGRGNTAFATRNYRVPRFAEKGEQVKPLWIRLELRLLANVGLVGLPNAGKSTLLSQISAARPKIASYPFTTISPNLGAVKIEDGKVYVFADIPGLIEGAHQGKGLGDKFLRHISRTRMLLHLMDLTSVNPENPLENYLVIMDELKMYNPQLVTRQCLVAANKIDVVGVEEAYFSLKEALEKEGVECHAISALTGEGVDDLVKSLVTRLEELGPPEEFMEEPQEDFVVIDARSEGLEEKHFEIEPVEDYFVVHGKIPERMVQMTDLENDEAVYHLQGRLKKMGIEEELARMGAKEGDFVVIGEFEFNYFKDKKYDLTDLPR